MDEEEIALNDARRVDQRHRRQAEDAELAEGPVPKDRERSTLLEPRVDFHTSSEASRASTAAEASRASLFTQFGVFGASAGGVGRVFRPSPTLTDDSMMD